ncbi:MAG TPA: Hsp33 family molecular chaperone HslO [Clostridiaceae bacterium]|nr:Hsp33 family molecular chaperone HslO [Clostridiaceae bacterium]
MSDYIIRATAAEGTVRAIGAVTTEIVREAQKIHNLSLTASVALGRTLTGGALLSQTLKGDKDVITIQIKGNGPLGGIVVVSDSKANVKGYVDNPDTETFINQKGKLKIAAAVGTEGYVNVIKDLGLREPYNGYVRLVSGEIAEDFAFYLTVSEQIPSVVSLGVLIDKDGSILNSGGFLIQVMPDVKNETIDIIEEKTASIPPVTELLSQGKSMQDILDMILGSTGLEIHEINECKYLCNCSRERMERNLVSLGEVEILDMVKEQHGAELVCHFCNKKYYFTEEELLNLVKGINEK